MLLKYIRRELRRLQVMVVARDVLRGGCGGWNGLVVLKSMGIVHLMSLAMSFLSPFSLTITKSERCVMCSIKRNLKSLAPTISEMSHEALCVT